MSGTICLLLEGQSLVRYYLFASRGAVSGPGLFIISRGPVSDQGLFVCFWRCSLWSGTIYLPLEEQSLVRDYLFAPRGAVSGQGLFVCS